MYRITLYSETYPVGVSYRLVGICAERGYTDAH
jgi:hypothetical protein